VKKLKRARARATEIDIDHVLHVLSEKIQEDMLYYRDRDGVQRRAELDHSHCVIQPQRPSA